MNTKDRVTKIIERTIDFLFLYNPLNTALGALFGMVLIGLKDILASVKQIVIDVHPVPLVAFGIFIFDIPCLFWGGRLPVNIEQKMKALEELQKRGDFSEEEKRGQWRALITEAIYSHETTDETEKEVVHDNKDTPIHT